MSEHLSDTNVGNIEYIRKEDALNALARAMPALTTPDGSGEFDHEIHIADEAFADAIRIIKSLEHADVAPVRHARWERYSGITIRCSRCEHVIHDWRLSGCKYCPNCGAKMDGEE